MEKQRDKAARRTERKLAHQEPADSDGIATDEMASPAGESLSPAE